MAKVLVVYYSRKGENHMPGGIQVLEKGNTEYAAEYIQKALNADIFEIDMELNVVLADQIRQEDTDGQSIVVEQKRPDYSGHYVIVQFIEYDQETGTIVVNLIREVQTPETTP